MKIYSLIGVITFLLGLIVIGEAIALLVGMHLLNKHSKPWISIKNDLLLAVDIITGAAIIYIAMVNGIMSQSNIVYLVMVFALLAHGYREWEYLINAPNKFCVNASLFAFNNIKLIGLLVVILLVVILKFIKV